MDKTDETGIPVFQPLPPLIVALALALAFLVAPDGGERLRRVRARIRGRDGRPRVKTTLSH